MRYRSNIKRHAVKPISFCLKFATSRRFLDSCRCVARRKESFGAVPTPDPCRRRYRSEDAEEYDPSPREGHLRWLRARNDPSNTGIVLDNRTTARVSFLFHAAASKSEPANTTLLTTILLQGLLFVNQVFHIREGNTFANGSLRYDQVLVVIDNLQQTAGMQLSRLGGSWPRF
jgi:hypothetical protein